MKNDLNIIYKIFFLFYTQQVALKPLSDLDGVFRTPTTEEKGFLKHLHEYHTLCKVRHPVRFYSSISRCIGASRDEAKEGGLWVGQDGSGCGGAQERSPHPGHRWLPLFPALRCQVAAACP
jgi:hypothetical protein